jgi:heme-degrading monooxygenase HmoA
MIIKLIVCDVEINQKDNFSKGQLAWKKLSNLDGFNGQIGGWNNSANQAIIIAVWDSVECIDKFMTSSHDKIFSESGQQNTYKRCEINYFEKILSIPSLDNSINLTDDSIFRIAYCKKVQDVEHFMKDQQEVWNIHMGQAKGMLGGFVLRNLEQKDYFIVVSHWASTKYHDNYVQHIFPKLKNQTMPTNYIKDLSGYLIQEESTWLVTSKHNNHELIALGYSD